MNKTIVLLLLALVPAAAGAHGLHGEPVPTVYYTPEAAYYVDDRVAPEHVLVSNAACGCCGCPQTSAAALPDRPVIVRSVMPVITECGATYYPTSEARYVAPVAMPCSHTHTTTCQHGYEVQHMDSDPGW